MSFPNTSPIEKYQEMLKDTTLLKQIGRGFGGGTVYKALEKDNPNHVAVKVVDLPDNTGNAESSNEGVISFEMRHKNIVHTHRYYKFNSCLILHMEYLEGNTLTEQLHQHGAIDHVVGQNIIKGVRSAIEYMHSNNVTHEDIHPGNVIIEENGKSKLIDFGCARKHETNSRISEECKRKDMDQIRRLQNLIFEFMF